jgi:hypothetical protein
VATCPGSIPAWRLRHQKVSQLRRVAEIGTYDLIDQAGGFFEILKLQKDRY